MTAGNCVLSIKATARQSLEKRSPASNLCEALECGSLLPLLPQPACWLGMVLPVENPASKLAGRKAAASYRTPKLRIPAQAGVALGAHLA
jgi:hypothetical protein